MIRFSGRYHPVASSSFEEVEANVSDKGLVEVIGHDDQIIETCHWKECRVSARIGSTPRKVTFPSGAVLQTTDNKTIDRCERRFRRLGLVRLIHTIERSPTLIILFLLGVVAVGYGYVTWGVPVVADIVARRLPADVNRFASEQAVSTLDKLVFTETKLPDDRKSELKQVLAAVIEASNMPDGCCRLLFRKGGVVQANAFALPDGTVVVTDEMVELAAHDDELFGVFAHELGHVADYHGMRMTLQSSMISLTIIFITADLGQFGEIAVALPATLLESGYSREFERSSDVFAAETMVKAGIDPARLADILDRLAAIAAVRSAEEDAEGDEVASNEGTGPTEPEMRGGKDGGDVHADTEPANQSSQSGQNWLSTHPATEERVNFLRNYLQSME